MLTLCPFILQRLPEKFLRAKRENVYYCVAPALALLSCICLDTLGEMIQ